MVMQVSATSCWNSADLIKKYGDNLKKFGATVDGIAIDKVILPEDPEECFNFEKSVKIEVNSLEVIRDFIGTFGLVIMGDNSIEIYDDYRE